MKEKNVQGEKQYKKGNPFKRAVMGFLVLTIAVAAGIAALVVYVDPFFHYHSTVALCDGNEYRQ